MPVISEPGGGGVGVVSQIVSTDGSITVGGTAFIPDLGATYPVGCVAAISALDIRLATAHQLKWDSLVNNFWDFTPLGAIPAGLGLTFAFDGSDGTVTVTDAGTWAMTLIVTLPQDATWQGQLRLPFTQGGVTQTDVLNYGNPVVVMAGQTLTLPVGAAEYGVILTQTPATANPYNAAVSLSLIRLG